MESLWTFDRIAIWNMDKIVSAISMAIWIADIGIIVNGKYFPTDHWRM